MTTAGTERNDAAGAADAADGTGPTRTRQWAAGAASLSAQAADTIMRILPRLLPWAYRVARIVRGLAVASAIAAVVIVGATLLLDVPRTAAPWLVLALVLAVLLIPAFVLRLFHRALLEVLALPDWLRTSPDLVRTHGRELGDLVLAAHGQATGSGRTSTAGRGVVRSAKLLLAAHGDLPEYGRAMRLLNPFFLFVVFVAFLAAVGEVLSAPFFLLIALGLSVLT